MQEVSKITQDHFVKMPFPVDPIPQRIKASVTHHSKGEIFLSKPGIFPKYGYAILIPI